VHLVARAHSHPEGSRPRYQQNRKAGGCRRQRGEADHCFHLATVVVQWTDLSATAISQTVLVAIANPVCSIRAPYQIESAKLPLVPGRPTASIGTSGMVSVSAQVSVRRSYRSFVQVREQLGKSLPGANNLIAGVRVAARWLQSPGNSSQLRIPTRRRKKAA
jgi:hypothetical protein